MVNGNGNENGSADLDAVSDHRAVSGESCGWGLPAFLLGD
jgi:hypothetical protein